VDNPLRWHGFDAVPREVHVLSRPTIFDVFWRLRKKADYEDAEVFVLGAAGDHDARGFAESLQIVSDATVAAIEVAVAAYVGAGIVAEAAAADLDRKRRLSSGFPISRRAASWATRASDTRPS
jgi:hypothetical protein